LQGIRHRRHGLREGGLYLLLFFKVMQIIKSPADLAAEQLQQTALLLGQGCLQETEISAL
jgi:hypothetical protein